MIIVGKGILGLAQAEYFSRPTIRSELEIEQIVVVSCDKKFAPGSNAAAANLSTKGQIFARDPHFAFKLEGKKVYLSWINSMLSELNSFYPCNIALSQLYRSGIGRDVFETTADAVKQFKRVFQESAIHSNSKKIEINKGALSTENVTTICYRDEAWVDARELLYLLCEICKLRGVHFVDCAIEEGFHLKKIVSLFQEKGPIILSAGAYILNLLEVLNLTPPPELKRPIRLTAGSTLHYSSFPFKGISDCVLLESVEENFRSKVTLSGTGNRVIASSSSVKVISSKLTESVPTKEELEQLNAANANLKVRSLAVLSAIQPNTFEKDIPVLKNGLRIGFGHQEIVMTQLLEKWNHLSVSLCVGAHKSGFLFAPVVGEKMHLLHRMKG